MFGVIFKYNNQKLDNEKILFCDSIRLVQIFFNFFCQGGASKLARKIRGRQKSSFATSCKRQIISSELAQYE